MTITAHLLSVSEEYAFVVQVNKRPVSTMCPLCTLSYVYLGLNRDRTPTTSDLCGHMQGRHTHIHTHLAAQSNRSSLRSADRKQEPRTDIRQQTRDDKRFAHKQKIMPFTQPAAVNAVYSHV